MYARIYYHDCTHPEDAIRAVREQADFALDAAHRRPLRQQRYTCHPLLVVLQHRDVCRPLRVPPLAGRHPRRLALVLQQTPASVQTARSVISRLGEAGEGI